MFDFICCCHVNKLSDEPEKQRIYFYMISITVCEFIQSTWLLTQLRGIKTGFFLSFQLTGRKKKKITSVWTCQTLCENQYFCVCIGMKVAHVYRCNVFLFFQRISFTLFRFKQCTHQNALGKWTIAAKILNHFIQNENISFYFIGVCLRVSLCT